MIAGDDSRHRAAMEKDPPPETDQLLRVPVRIIAPDGRIIEGDGVIDTGSSWSTVDAGVDLPRIRTRTCTGASGERVDHVVEAVLSVDGVELPNPGTMDMAILEAVAVIGLDVLSRCAFTYANSQFTLKGVQK